MRGAMYRREGPAAEVLVIGEVPDPPNPGPGEVLVRIALSALNPTDVKGRAGSTPRPIDGFQVPGMDGAGEIVAVGPDVDRDRVGQRVWLFLAAFRSRWGTCAEYCLIDAAQAVPLPASASDELGACLGVPALTAHEVLTLAGPIEGTRVLVQGATGGVGHYAVELATHLGASVVGTAGSDEKCAAAVELGASHAVNYRADDALDRLRELGPFDAITEVDLVTNLEPDLQVLRTGGTITTYAADARAVSFPPRLLMGGCVGLRFFLLYAWPRAHLLRAAERINAAIESAALTTLPIVEYPLDAVVAAHERVEALAPGKTLVRL